MVAPDTENAPDYSSTDFLKLSGPNGTWNTKFGGQDGAGKGVVVGVIDTGYTPSSAFFAGEEVKPLVGEPVVGVPVPHRRTARSRCSSPTATPSSVSARRARHGPDFDGSACNSKVLSAHYFAEDFLKYVPADKRAPSEKTLPGRRRQPRHPHGQHRRGQRQRRDVRRRPQLRPDQRHRARPPSSPSTRSAGKTPTPTPAAATAPRPLPPSTRPSYDGVDVLNYSISGSTSTTTDPVSMAFLSAASAGIFVAASAGNSGPTASTVNHGAPVGHHGRRQQLLPGAPGHRRILRRQQVPRRQHHEPRGQGRRRRAGCQRGRRRRQRRTRPCAARTRWTPPRSPARSSSVTAASSTASPRAPRSSAAAASA